uniref:translation initiation factor IF-2 N-terminal domain-containing protein n=1 Tax=Corynebacterium pacaense TaxID=1816684 RepID=UPI0015C42B3D
MPGKLRVHELAKKLGITSKELLATLKAQGEFVKTASSTIEPPVVKKMQELYTSQGGKQSASEKPGARPGGAPKPGAPKKPGQGPKPGAPGTPKPATPAAPAAAQPAPAAPKARPS